MRFAPSRLARYEEFVAAHADELVKLAYSVCGDRDRAQDAAQEALTVVYQRWQRLSDPLAYARRTAINATRADRRRSIRADRAYRESAHLSSVDTEHPQERFVVSSALLDALNTLPLGQRAVIALRYGSQLSEAETAATLDISVGTVKSQTARALARMRDELSHSSDPATRMEVA